MDEKPKPPPTPLSYQAPSAPPTYTQYDRVTDTVVGINVRARDNLRQLLAGAIGAVCGAGAAFFMGMRGPVPYVGLAFGGFLAGILIFGVYLGIVGLRRATRR